MHAETSKNEDTWYKMLGHYDAENYTAQRVFDEQWRRWHLVHIDSNRNPNVFNLNCNDDGKRWLNTNYINSNDKLDLENEWVFRNSLHFSRGFMSGEFCFVS